MTDTKICTKCREDKPTTDFYIQRTKKSGLTSQCKTCSYETVLAWRKRNPDKVDALTKRYRKKHPEKSALALARYRAKHRAKYNAYMRAYNAKRKAKLRTQETTP